MVALKLKHFQYYGKFPEKTGDFSIPAVTFVANQLGCEPACIKDYLFGNRTEKLHHAMIRSFLGFKRMSQKDWEEFRKLAFSLYLPEGDTIHQLTDRLVA